MKPKNLRADVLAGLTTSFALLPECIAFALVAGPALAGPVTLRADIVDDDGRITLGELFEGDIRAANRWLKREGRGLYAAFG